MEHQHLESLYPATSRHWEIEQLLSYVKKGESCEMIAFPGVGRGNVCKLLCYNRAIRIKHLGEKQTQYHFVFVNFAEVKNRELFDVMKFIFLQITTSLHERLFNEEFAMVDTLFRKALGYKDDLVLFEGLKKALDFLVHEKGMRIILLLERFETYIPRLTETFFINLRSLRDTAKYAFSVIFSTTRPLEDVVEHSMLADFYEFFAGRYVFLQIHDTPGILFRIGYLEKIVGETIDAGKKKELLRLTGGHGKLTRLGTEILITNSFVISSKHARLGRDDKLSIFLLSQRTIQQALKEIWEFLTPGEQEKIKQQELRITNESPPINHFLEQVGLLKKTRVAIPLLTVWIQEQANKPEDKPIVYDPEANTIKKGDRLISEELTASEFRLLQYLLENSDKVLEREHIITAVWKDNATTLGVTDQAFDQLLFRLRKKIEQNPNKPTLIETIKGRGVRYNKI